MESYLNDFNSILRNVFEAEGQADELIAVINYFFNFLLLHVEKL